MSTMQTIQLLKECDAGSKMAVSSMKEILGDIKSEKMLQILTRSISRHEKFGNEMHEMLNELHQEGKEPPTIAKISSWVKINFKMLEEPSDKTIASMMVDGCNMGTKSLSGYLNDYPQADKKSRRLAEKLINIETDLADELREFL